MYIICLGISFICFNKLHCLVLDLPVLPDSIKAFWTKRVMMRGQYMLEQYIGLLITVSGNMKNPRLKRVNSENKY